ncbi:MAG: type II toxin-antitoxin system VapC family toxin [Propionibacteriaceae bacterium]|jgi:ribonuclease VapC|nr:type II toxin-antitoxin system VapC family toxin [Propionibacteriaceae bacterium]
MILDTSAIVAILNDEPEADAFIRIIAAEAEPLISAPTVVELHAVADGRGDPAQARRVDQLLRTLGVRVVAFDADQADVARSAYRDYGRGSGHPAKLNLGDCFTYALAASTGQPLLCKGDDFWRTDLDLVPVDGEPPVDDGQN